MGSNQSKKTSSSSGYTPVQLADGSWALLSENVGSNTGRNGASANPSMIVQQNRLEANTLHPMHPAVGSQPNTQTGNYASVQPRPLNLPPSSSFSDVTRMGALSAEQIAFLQGEFSLIANGKSFIDFDTFRVLFLSALCNVNYQQLNVMARDAFSKLDRNRDGAIDFQEFVEGYKMLQSNKSISSQNATSFMPPDLQSQDTMGYH